MRKRILLAAVQFKIVPEAYRSEEAFRRALARSLEGLPKASHTLVLFPEAIGLPLLLTPYHEVWRKSRSIEEAMRRLLLGHPLEAIRLLGAMLASARLDPVKAFMLHAAPGAFRIYRRSFSWLAKSHHCTCVAGSLYAPEIVPPAGPTVGNKIYNISYIFGPDGACLGYVKKMQLVPGLEDREGLNISCGLRQQQGYFETPEGVRFGHLICYDAFFDRYVRDLDEMGVEVLCQGSANPEVWHRAYEVVPGRIVPKRKECLEEGVAFQIQGRRNIRYGMTAMMVGDFLDLHFEGQSLIAANRDLCGGGGNRGVLAMAPTEKESYLVAKEVEV